jgi:hypothetical protein
MSAAATPTIDNATPEQALERTRTVLNWLLDGVPASVAVERAEREWQLGQRMAQVYVKRAKELLAEQTDEAEFRYYCQLSQQQRDMLLQMVMQAVKIACSLEPGQLRALATLAATGTKLLDSRDKLVFGQIKHAADEARKQRREETQQVIRESQEFLEKMKQGPPPGWGQPRWRPPQRPLEPGELVFSPDEPFDPAKLSPKQKQEWDAVNEHHGNPLELPWVRPGAFRAQLEKLLREPNPTEGIAIVKPPAPGKKNRPADATQSEGSKPLAKKQPSG